MTKVIFEDDEAWEHHLAEIRAEAVKDFVDAQSVAYGAHSSNAIVEDMKLAVKEFGVDANAAGWGPTIGAIDVADEEKD